MVTMKVAMIPTLMYCILNNTVVFMPWVARDMDMLGLLLLVLGRSRLNSQTPIHGGQITGNVINDDLS